MAEAIAKSLDNANSAQVGYFIGYLTFNILEFFVPITKVAKARSINDLFKGAASLKAGVAKASGIAATAGSGFLKALEDFIAFLRRGGEGLKKLSENIFEGVGKWLKELRLRGFSRVALDRADELGLEIKLIQRKSTSRLAVGAPHLTSKELYAILDKHGRRIAAGSKDDLEKIFRSKITKVAKNLLKVDFGHYYIRKSKGNYTKVRSEGLIHIGDDGKSTFVLRGSADEVREAITSGRKLFGKTGIIQLGKGKYSVLYKGREIFRNGEILAKNLLDEINAIGGKIPDEWLAAFDDIYALRTAYGAEPFNLLTATGSNGAFAKLINAGKEEIQGVSINLRRAITRSEKDVDLPLRESGYNLVKDYHPTKNKDNLPGFLTHAEATVLTKASQNGKITKKMAMFVDRKTCDLCLNKENGIVPLLKSMGVDEILIYNGHTLKPIIIEKYLKDSDKAYKITRYIKGIKKIKVYRYR